MVFLEFKEVMKRFGKKEVLSEVSFTVKQGEIFGLIGVSGGGKTTLLNILVGMARASGGKILFGDKNVLRKPSYLRKAVGFATQRNMLFEELSLKENAFYFGKLYKMRMSDILSRFEELTSLLGLDGFEDFQIRKFSGGMIKRANLLVSLIHNPKLLVLDEPTIGLDPLLRDILWKYIHSINLQGTTIIVISHLLEEIEENCKTIGILKRGKIVALGGISQYKRAYKNKSLSDIFEDILKNERI